MTLVGSVLRQGLIPLAMVAAPGALAIVEEVHGAERATPKSYAEASPAGASSATPQTGEAVSPTPGAPEPLGPNEVGLCAWNIRKLGHGETKDYAAVADLIRED